MKAQYLSVPRQSKTSRTIDLATSDGHSSRMALRYGLLSFATRFFILLFSLFSEPTAAISESNTGVVSDEESRGEDDNLDDSGEIEEDTASEIELPFKRKAVLEEPTTPLCADDGQHFLQEKHKKLKDNWYRIWEESTRSQRMAEIDENFPFNKFRKNTYSLTRYQASLMIQIRCGHIPLNAHLSRINRSDTEICQACQEHKNGLQCRETVKHFLFECMSYTQEREELIGKIGIRHLNLRDIMKNTDYMKALATFIEKTKRFKKN
jgi:hypothetical protein